MIKLKVKSIWQGKCGIRDKYIQQAFDEKTGLQITCQHSVMTIPAGEVQKKIVAKSEKPFRDKFSRKFHFLYYFNWKPTVNQKKLL